MTKPGPVEGLGLTECLKEAIRRGRQTLTLPAAERLCRALGLRLASEGPLHETEAEGEG